MISGVRKAGTIASKSATTSASIASSAVPWSPESIGPSRRLASGSIHGSTFYLCSFTSARASFSTLSPIPDLRPQHLIDGALISEAPARRTDVQTQLLDSAAISRAVQYFSQFVVIGRSRNQAKTIVSAFNDRQRIQDSRFSIADHYTPRMRRKGEPPGGRHFRSDRFVTSNGSWYFTTREHIEVGPFKTRADAVKGSDRLIAQLRLISDPEEARKAIRDFNDFQLGGTRPRGPR